MPGVGSRGPTPRRFVMSLLGGGRRVSNLLTRSALIEHTRQLVVEGGLDVGEVPSERVRGAVPEAGDMRLAIGRRRNILPRRERQPEAGPLLHALRTGQVLEQHPGGLLVLGVDADAG